MTQPNIIAKLEIAGLLGRGGADFPTYLKWQMLKSAKADRKYIVANGSEGEPAVAKDGWVLEHHPAELISGLKLALGLAKNSQAFIFLRKDYYQKYKKKLEQLIGDLPITVWQEKGGYLSGEETTLCQEIEDEIRRPRVKPPYPGQAGIFGKPTLINNIETFYFVSRIARDEYEKTRLYTISGAVKKPGVFERPIYWSIEEILADTGNLPKFDCFVQVGGGASGEILLANELNHRVGGSGAIVVYNKAKTDPWKLLYQWISFFMQQNCDKCTPCREGTYRLREMIRQRKIDPKVADELFYVLENTSFCALGKSVVLPFRSALAKLL